MQLSIYRKLVKRVEKSRREKGTGVKERNPTKHWQMQKTNHSESFLQIQNLKLDHEFCFFLKWWFLLTLLLNQIYYKFECHPKYGDFVTVCFCVLSWTQAYRTILVPGLPKYTLPEILTLLFSSVWNYWLECFKKSLNRNAILGPEAQLRHNYLKIQNDNLIV